MIAPAFRFDASAHAYFLGDQQVPSITQLIERGGLLNGQAYYTEASRERGQEVHRLCADYELGALNLPKLETPYRGYVLGYVAAVEALKPTWSAIEVADVHPKYRFGGRPDRVGQCFRRLTVAEIKSGCKPPLPSVTYTDAEGRKVTVRRDSNAHAVQAALQAILIAWRHGVTPEAVQRLVIYLKSTGKFSVERHTSVSDFHEAMRLIKEFC